MPKEGLNAKSHSELQEHFKAKFRYGGGQPIVETKYCHIEFEAQRRGY